MKKLAFLAAALALVPTLFSVNTVFAASEGHLSSGPGMYTVRVNNGADAETVSATCDNVLKFSLQLANSEFGLVKNINVKADLATGGITATGTNSVNASTSVSADVNVNLDKGSLEYVAGSTVVTPITGPNSYGTPVTKVDGITAGGVNVGDLNGSTREYVQFQAKVKCDVVEEPKNIQVCELATKKVITIKETDFDAAKHSKNLDDCKTVEEKKITVCLLSNKTTITIKESEFDAAKHSKNLNDCKTSTPGKITVCVLDTKKVVTINENEFDAAKHDKDLNKCAEVLPATIVSTGPASTIATMVGLSTLAAAGTYFVRSRRNILG